MAANFGTRAQKLYFDVTMAATATNASFPCTQITAGTPGDRYGRLLQVLEALTGSSPPNIKARRAVSAWFQAVAFSPANATTPNAAFAVRFISPTGRGSNQATLASLPYLTIGGNSVTNKAGSEAIYGTAGILRHFSVQVQKRISAGTVSAHGVLYVQRQHTIEV